MDASNQFIVEQNIPGKRIDHSGNAISISRSIRGLRQDILADS